MPEGPSKERGLILGRKAAEEILELRGDDGSAAPDTYRPVTRPGQYVPTRRVVQRRCRRLDAVGDEQRDAIPRRRRRRRSTRRYGPATSTRSAKSARSTAGCAAPNKLPSARFWFVTGPRSWNPLVVEVAAAKHMDLLDSARLFALVSLACTDAFIAVFEAKYHYNFWRPITAIRNADQTGNAATPREAGWLPLGETPMHPEYPCAHCITSSAVAAVLRGRRRRGHGNAVADQRHGARRHAHAGRGSTTT